MRRGRGPALFGLVLLGVLVTVALAAPLLAPYDPTERAGRPFAPPSGAHLLGTNDVGHDLLSELIYGARVSLLVGVVAALAATAVGAAVGVAAGYARGRLDTVLMRLVDIVLALPVLPLTIVVGVFAGPGLATQIAVIAAVMWAGVARELRAQVLSLRERDYVQAERAMGAGPLYVARRHLLPAVSPLVVPQFVLATKTAILLEASLAFLGLGDVTSKSWGTMLSIAHARSAFLTDAWIWWVLPPGLAIALTVLAFAFLGYAFEEQARPSLPGRVRSAWAGLASGAPARGMAGRAAGAAVPSRADPAAGRSAPLAERLVEVDGAPPDIPGGTAGNGDDPPPAVIGPAAGHSGSAPLEATGLAGGHGRDAPLEVVGLTVCYDDALSGEGVIAVDGADLRVGAGELVGLVGESGSGKSTLAAAVVDLLPPSARVLGGSVRVEGRELAALTPAQRRRLRGDRIALIPQEAMSALNPVMRIGDQLAEAVRVHRRSHGAPARPRWGWAGRRHANRAARARAAQLLELVGIDPARGRDYPHQFSGGMRQRVVIAMALANEPAVVIADEPTTGLDVLVQADVLALLDELRSRLGLALLVVSHDLPMIERIADRIAVMQAGRIVETGPARQIATTPAHPYTRMLVESAPRLQTPVAGAAR